MVDPLAFNGMSLLDKIKLNGNTLGGIILHVDTFAGIENLRVLNLSNSSWKFNQNYGTKHKYLLKVGGKFHPSPFKVKTKILLKITVEISGHLGPLTL